MKNATQRHAKQLQACFWQCRSSPCAVLFSKTLLRQCLRANIINIMPTTSVVSSCCGAWNCAATHRPRGLWNNDCGGLRRCADSSHHCCYPTDAYVDDYSASPSRRRARRPRQSKWRQPGLSIEVTTGDAKTFPHNRNVMYIVCRRLQWQQLRRRHQ